ncbi:hypothetical protein [Xanthomonas arboricola]|uniref:hypothetical protein n=1 Tax=Xanthomonas arboricola TaxID=56448 RepID=UPI001AF72E5A|nr:hypothetical protein [Xanthomonas arboricola]CAD7377064.1 hypothetical protein X12_000736 [Xanthomonas arboricola]CAG2084728.1 hypothetical protein XCY_000735 [Xanthomonas arboricola pv. juglandis]
MIGAKWMYIRLGLTASLLFAALAPPLAAQESICARVKIEIKQELTLERQAFDAEMRITNSLPATPLTQVEVQVRVTDENGTPVTVTTDPNNLTAQFFIRQTHDDTSGNGEVKPSSTAVLNWLLIPAAGSAGNTPSGKRYLVGATLRYMFGNELQEMQLNPDVITVKPMPSLALDYFLTRDVIADDPMTTEIEAPEPYTLGVRVKNSGLAEAKALKIDSAQPKIIENNQGLAVNFMLLGSYLQDAPVGNTLLIDFGDIAPNSAKMGRWLMESNLAGKFVEFSARFTHSDELGGALTSLLESANAHLLVRDVRVDLPGRDLVRDFLAVEGSNRYTVYESSGVDSEVSDRSAEAQLTATGNGYQLGLPATQGFFYIRKPDPHRGQMALGSVMRADAKLIATENVWLSKTKNADTKAWEYWFNVFDVNSPGGYQVAFQPITQVPAAPVLQFIPDRVVKEGEQVSFLVEASSPMGRRVSITASPLPAGAALQDQGDGTAVFDWTPAVGQSGSYVIGYKASDGSLSGTRSAKIRVDSKVAPEGPATPRIVAPLASAEVRSQRPLLQVQTGEDGSDPTASVTFEIYADVAMTRLLAQGSATRNATVGQATQWQPPADLDDNTRYYWRARASGGGLNSAWVTADFFVNLFNNAPGSFNLSSPASGATVATQIPLLSASNAVDVDGDVVRYAYEVYKDSALSQLHEGVADLPAGEHGHTEWQMSMPLDNGASYYWRAVATDEHGARTVTPARVFTVDTAAMAPEAPTIVAPLPGAYVSTAGKVTLQVRNGAAPADAVVNYVFEIDAVETFNSSARQISPSLAAGAGGQTSWTATNLVENTRYYWRARAVVGQVSSQWVQGEFVLDAQNTAPSIPVLEHPGDGAWITSAYPTFSVYPSQDLEEEAISYTFELYGDAALTARVAAGAGIGRTWQASGALEDARQYFWRARAQDARGAASAWSAAAGFTVNTGHYTAPTIAVIGPATLIDAGNRQAMIEWIGSTSNAAPRVALYHDSTGRGYAGTRIVEGLVQDGGKGRYVWNMAGLPPGPYYVYAVIYDDRGSTHTYAPGTLVIPAEPRLGQVTIRTVGDGRVVESKNAVVAEVALSRAPTAPVTVSLSSSNIAQGTVSPNEFVFTPDNWRAGRRIWLAASRDRVADDHQPVDVTIGTASSLDPQFMGSAGGVVKAVAVDDGEHTDIAGLSVSAYQLTSKSYVESTKRWTYRYRVTMSNRGPKVNTVLAKILSGSDVKLVAYNLRFGAIERDESALSEEEIVFTSAIDLGDKPPQLTWELKAF